MLRPNKWIIEYKKLRATGFSKTQLFNGDSAPRCLEATKDLKYVKTVVLQHKNEKKKFKKKIFLEILKWVIDESYGSVESLR